METGIGFNLDKSGGHFVGVDRPAPPPTGISFSCLTLSAPVITVDEETSLRDIAEILSSQPIKRVPVVRDGRIVGIVSRADLIRALVAHPRLRPTWSADCGNWRCGIENSPNAPQTRPSGTHDYRQPERLEREADRLAAVAKRS